MSARIVAVDHFAGTGWSVACRWLGIREYGVEIMPEAIRTRRAVGFRTIYRDVWSGLLHAWLVPFHDLYIASPPCQTFSVAGRGTGRKALEMVLTLIASGAWKHPEKLRAAGADLGDDRTALVLTPLAHIWVHRPRLVALEQVPTVLPVWEAVAEVLRGLGYSVWTGNLQAEQYGVPQTRKRAILMARLGGPVAPPVPTHSRYYSRDPQRLDPGVQKWVSMAEALGWAASDAVGFPRLADEHGDTMSINGVEYRARDLRPATEPSFVVTEKGRSWSRFGADGTVSRVTVDDAAALQTYPSARKRMGAGMVERYGDRPGRDADEPAFTIRASAGGREPGGFVFESAEGVTRKMRPEEAAALQTFPKVVYRNGNQANAARRPLSAPAPTIHFGARSNKVEWIDAELAADTTASGVRVSADEAARFQTFPVPFPFQGARGKQFLQIGNAVPPLLAYAILRVLVDAPLTAAKSIAEPLEEVLF